MIKHSKYFSASVDPWPFREKSFCLKQRRSAKTPRPTPAPTAVPKSCVDFANNGIVDDGIFHVDLDEDGVADTYAYCDFDGDFAWTLIESGVKTNLDYQVVENSYLNQPFYVSAPVGSLVLQSPQKRTQKCLSPWLFIALLPFLIFLSFVCAVQRLRFVRHVPGLRSIYQSESLSDVARGDAEPLESIHSHPRDVRSSRGVSTHARLHGGEQGGFFFHSYGVNFGRMPGCHRNELDG